MATCSIVVVCRQFLGTQNQDSGPRELNCNGPAWTKRSCADISTIKLAVKKYFRELYWKRNKLTLSNAQIGKNPTPMGFLLGFTTEITDYCHAPAR
jgi:hypothetical protein